MADPGNPRFISNWEKAIKFVSSEILKKRTNYDVYGKCFEVVNIKKKKTLWEWTE